MHQPTESANRFADSLLEALNAVRDDEAHNGPGLTGLDIEGYEFARRAVERVRNSGAHFNTAEGFDMAVEEEIRGGARDDEKLNEYAMTATEIVLNARALHDLPQS